MELSTFPTFSDWNLETDALLGTATYFFNRPDGIAINVEFDCKDHEFIVATVDGETYEDDQRVKRFGSFTQRSDIPHILCKASDINHFEASLMPTQLIYRQSNSSFNYLPLFMYLR